MIVKTLAVGPLQANCHIVGCEKTKQAVVIDPGDEAGRILRTLRQLDLSAVGILLTHAHFDHIGAAADLASATGLPVAVHPDDLPLLQAGGGAAIFEVPGAPMPSQVSSLVAGQEIAVGEVRLRVLHTPGHTPGHVTFHAAAERAVFVGDVLFAQGIGRTDLPGGSYARLMRSIHQHLMVLPDDTVVYSGHGPATTIGEERLSNPWLAPNAAQSDWTL